MKRLRLSLMLASALLASPAAAAGFEPARTACSYDQSRAVHWDVAAKWGSGRVSLAALKAGVAAANAFWADPANADTNVVLEIRAGDWKIGGDGGPGILLDGLNAARPGARGWLVIAGHGMRDTTLDFTDIAQRGFFGRDVNRLHVCNLHLTRPIQTVSQGRVVGFLQRARWSPGDPAGKLFGAETLADPGALDTSGAQTRFLVVRIDPGFPGLDAIYNPASGQGRYVRKYRYRNGRPEIVEEDNRQSAWVQKARLANGDWVIGLKRNGAHYAVGDTVAIKSKKAADAVWFAIGGHVTFENIRLTRASRMLFRHGLDHIRIANVSIERVPLADGRIPFLSTAEGGPQLGQPNDGPIGDVTVENFRAEGTGDDSIALFDVAGSDRALIANVAIADSFGRGIYVDRTTTNICFRAAQLDRNPLLLDNPAFRSACPAEAQGERRAATPAAGK
jgi:hypothetical protein